MTSKPPVINYPSKFYSLAVNIPMTPISPSVTENPLTDCTSSPALPWGLVLDTATCTISGTPKMIQPAILYTITAQNKHGKGTASITITVYYDTSPRALTGITITPTTPSISRNFVRQLIATAHYYDGATADVTGAATWSSGNPGVVSISATGVATGETVGTTNITATWNGISGSTNINVTLPVWTWTGGSATAGVLAGSYGTLGVAGGTPPTRSGSATWSDNAGNMWLFGGSATTSYYNDLWKYNAAANQWTWISGSSTVNTAGTYGIMGIAASGNTPGARSYSLSWTDNAGNLWLFGGSSASGMLNELWKYNPSVNMWTWVSGSSTVNTTGAYPATVGGTGTPGARTGSATWIDASGNLWLFGGYGYSSGIGYLNDLWKFSPVTNQWTWINGSNTSVLAGIYGTLGIAATGNVPGGRQVFTSWVDISGNLWLFGGNGYASNTTLVQMNDLWKYNPAANQWTWVSGSNTGGAAGVYGTQGVAATANVPCGRTYGVSWTDIAGKFWMFGGQHYTANGAIQHMMNDLWKYNPAANQWTWVSGSNALSTVNTYPASIGITGVPGSRQSSNVWRDIDGNLWLVYGSGYDTASSVNSLNDIWKFGP